VQVGQDTTIEFISYPGKKFAGRIQRLGPSLDPLTRTVDVWVSVGNDEGILRPNLFARVGVVLRQADAALTVPTAAVIEATGERFVFVKQPTGYVRTEIETGVRDSQLTEVAEGLAAGDKVVVQGNRQVYTLWLTGGAPIHDEDD
jgi:RND family efflux transporter MFP subunit